MSNNTGLKVKNLRICVEPVDVELDEDSGILWTSLQTAFPGCSGMYYRENGDSCKKSVRFDGKKFCAPGGAWNDRNYFVTLSQRCHSAGNHSTSSIYSEATKQFEKNVNLVQKMLAASGMKIETGNLYKKRHLSSSSSSKDTTSSTTSSTVISDPIQAIKERSELLQSADRQLTPLEQQFVDLAKISTAKDQIIDSHRQEITKLNGQISELEKKINNLNSQLIESKSKIEGQEEELEILRNLGGQFGETKETVKELKEKNHKNQEEISNLQLKMMNIDEENLSLKSQLETAKNEIKEMNESIQILTSTRELLSKELDQLRPLAESASIEDFEKIPKFIDALNENKQLQEENEKMKNEIEASKNAFYQIENTQKTIFDENAKLRKRNEDLEKRFEHVDEEVKCLNENWAKELRDKQQDWQKITSEAEIEIVSLRDQLSHLQGILEAATREAAENARRVSELEQERNEVRKKSDAIHIKTQDDLRNKIRFLTDDLREAENRVAELNILVSSLVSDINNSKREISDIL